MPPAWPESPTEPPDAGLDTFRDFPRQSASSYLEQSRWLSNIWAEPKLVHEHFVAHFIAHFVEFL